MSQAISLSSQTEKVTCRLCGRQFAKYNCPTCNVAYCSLSCFRSPNHTNCSETFYKKEVENEIQSQPSKTLQERMKMMELLKRFEENQQDDTRGSSLDGESEDEAEQEEGDDLSRRFQDMDLNSASTADVWSKLTLTEREKFLQVMEDPAGGLAKQLLASEELENERIGPWWEASSVEPDGESTTTRQYGAKPGSISVPSNMIKSIPDGSPLLYNVCAVCIAYAFTTRRVSVSPLSSLRSEDIDFEEARRLVSHLAPFLTDRKSVMLHPDVTSMITDVWSRFEPGQIDSGLFGLLLRDTAQLVRPLPVMAYSSDTSQSQGAVRPTSHPHINLIRVLSDLTEIFQVSLTHSSVIVKPNHTTRKLLFYAAHVLSTPSSILRMLAEQLEETSTDYRADIIGDISKRQQDDARTAFVQEL